MKKIFNFILTFVLVGCIFFSTQVSAFEISGFDLNARAAMLVSLDTGDVLYAKNSTDKMYPASLTKMLVAVIMMENTSDWQNEKITMTDSAMKAILGTGSSVIGLKVGEELTATDALHCLLISSGGDVAYAIAEHYGGSVENFLDMMNNKAAEIGMKNSHFGNPVGLHDEYTYTTAEDISKLAIYALNFSIFKEVTSKPRYTVAPTNKSPSRTLSTTNFLIDPTTNYYYQYSSGIKTGFTDEAGRCLASTATYNGYSYLCIIMGCDGTGGKRNEFLDSKNLYRWAFNGFEFKSVLDTTKPVTEMPVELSLSTDHVKLYPEKSITRILPKDADSSTLSIIPHLNAESVDAPVNAGDILGTADIIYAEENIGTVNLIAGETVKSSFLLVFARTVKNIVSSLAFKLILLAILLVIIIYIIMIIRLNARSKSHRKVKYIPYNKHSDKDRRR